MSEKQSVEEYATQMRVFIKNRQEFPPDELSKYAGKSIAFSPDGTSIVASADDIDELIERIQAAGYDPGRCFISYVDA
jgi:hypothetical protein